jgi:hypothetical protein
MRNAFEEAIFAGVGLGVRYGLWIMEPKVATFIDAKAWPKWTSVLDMIF